MDAIVNWYFPQLIVGFLVLARISGLVTTAPVFGSRSVPVRIRALLAIGMTLLVVPPLGHGLSVVPENLFQLSALIARELMIGLSMGLAIVIVLSGLQVAGQIASQMSGMALAEVFDPTYDSNVPVFSQLMDLVTLALFVILGGHRMVISALLGTFQTIPLAEGRLGEGAGDLLASIVTESFVLGIRAGAPMMVSLLLSILVLGLVSRTLPQLNVMAVGFGLNAIMALGTMSIVMGSIAWIFQEPMEATLVSVREMFQAAMTSAP